MQIIRLAHQQKETLEDRNRHYGESSRKVNRTTNGRTITYTNIRNIQTDTPFPGSSPTTHCYFFLKTVLTAPTTVSEFEDYHQYIIPSTETITAKFT